MGKNLAQAPLTAIIFAAIWCFLTPFVITLFSDEYREVFTVFSMPLLGYAFMVAYGFWLSIILALMVSGARGKGVVVIVLMAIPILFTQWIVPSVKQIAFGEITGVMSRNDCVFTVVAGIVATIFLLVFALLLFKPPLAPPEPPRPPHAPPLPPKKPDKYLFKKRNFVITLIVLPVIYMTVFFLTWYFLLLRSEAAREFYSVSADTDNFAKYLVDMLLTDNKQIPMALIKGLLYTLPLIPLLIEFAHKRAMFIIITVMLLLGPALYMLIPSVVMPDAVRQAHLIEMSAAAVVFGGLAAFMMHMCVFKEPVKEPPHVPMPVRRVAPAAAEGDAAAQAGAAMDAQA